MSNKRDFRYLTDSEKKEWGEIQQKETIRPQGGLAIKANLWSEYPSAVRRHISLFPNQYLDPLDLRDTSKLERILDSFEELIKNPGTRETDILNFINNNSHYFIIGALLKNNFNFGHHEAHVFSEFPLSTSHRADYLLLGKNSDGWHFVFVELEAPNGSTTLANGSLGQAFRKGIDQIEEWEHWLESNFQNLQEYFKKHISPQENLVDEFYRFDKTRINFVVIAGRREHFNETTRRIRRLKKQEKNLNLFHYDNLLDECRYLLNGGGY